MRSSHHRQTMNYPYAAWRRILFVAVLVVIIVIAFAPATTQGTMLLRFSSVTSSSVVSHIYIGFTQIALHQTGYLNSSGWVIISQRFPTIDLLSSQTIPPSGIRDILLVVAFDYSTLFSTPPSLSLVLVRVSTA